MYLIKKKILSFSKIVKYRRENFFKTVSGKGESVNKLMLKMENFVFIDEF